MDSAYDDWEPPSASELKLLQARRERSDKISKLMGDYLLKGYKMLGITCPECDTILLQTKQETNYCIACSELDRDADKDDPVTNQAAALALAREKDAASTTHHCPPPLQTQACTAGSTPQASRGCFDISSSSERGGGGGTLNPLPGGDATSHLSADVRAGGEGGRPGGSEKYVRELLDKMDWAVRELRGTGSVEQSIQLCGLVKACADAVASVKKALDS